MRPVRGEPVDGSSPDSFADVYAAFQPKIRRYLSRLVGTTEADDLTQDVFVKVNQALSGFRGESSLSTWIYRIATNVAYDHLRSGAATSRQALLQIGRPSTDARPGIDEHVANTEMNRCVRAYIDGLPPPYRSVLVLSEDEGLSDQEIADALGISVGTVKIRLHRARARLKTTFQQVCYRDDWNELACKPADPPVSPRR